MSAAAASAELAAKKAACSGATRRGGGNISPVGNGDCYVVNFQCYEKQIVFCDANGNCTYVWVPIPI
jgi:hypothetical protein